MKLTAKVVRDIASDCFFKIEELVDGKPPIPFTEVKSVRLNAGFHTERLMSHKEEIRKLLDQLPDEFKVGTGDGMSFLNACVDKNNDYWGEHRDIDLLFALGIGVGLVRFCAPRDMWNILPGGMPYIQIGEAKKEGSENVGS